MKKVRVAVIGTGWWASDVHIPALLEHPQAELAALCDLSAERLRATAAKYGVSATYTHLETMLAEQTLDAAVVASSNASHFTVAKACLEHGLHVLVEKPLTLRAQEAKSLLELAEAKKRQLVVGYSFNFLPFAKCVKEVFKSGKLGRIQYVQAVYSSDMTPFFQGTFDREFSVHGPTQYVDPVQLGGGHGQVQVTHVLGLLFFLTDLHPFRVAALMNLQGAPVDVVDAMTVAFEGGALGTVGGTGNQRGVVFRLLVSCERGCVDLDAGARRAAVYRRHAEPELLEEQGGFSGRLSAQNLVAVALGEADNGSPAEGGWRAVEVLEAAYRSAARDGIFIPIKELYENH
ncbi:Gfo/Idh/MocA family oxidoreductase [soil metagenome]